MNSHYFSQFLLNRGKINADDVKRLLSLSASVKPQLPIMAVRQGLLNAAQVADLATLPANDFTEAVVERGLLTSAQVENLLQTVTGESLSFAQAMLDEGSSLSELEMLFKEFDECKEMPICEAVGKAAGAELENELPSYVAFTEVFMRSLVRFMDTPAVINVAEPFIFGGAESSHIVSQELVGDVSLVTGIYATDDVFIELAKRYSCEPLETVDGIAIDSLMEFINVLNGLYAVELSRNDQEADLEAPKWAENQEPLGNQQLVLRIDTGFGSFALIMAADEFVFG